MLLLNTYPQTQYLDEEFDAPDVEADRELCCAIVAGRCGMHPDGWGYHAPLTAIMPQGFRGYEWVPEAYRRPIARSAAAIAEQRRENTEWADRHRRRPAVVHRPEPPKRIKPFKPRRPANRQREALRSERRAMAAAYDNGGWIQLTCDECGVRAERTLRYPAGERPLYVATIRAIGHDAGWTCIVGRDRCPKCSALLDAAPDAVRNGAGKDQGHE